MESRVLPLLSANSPKLINHALSITYLSLTVSSKMTPSPSVTIPMVISLLSYRDSYIKHLETPLEMIVLRISNSFNS
jgi:hypothetical protein